MEMTMRKSNDTTTRELTEAELAAVSGGLFGSDFADVIFGLFGTSSGSVGFLRADNDSFAMLSYDPSAGSVGF